MFIKVKIKYPPKPVKKAKTVKSKFKTQKSKFHLQTHCVFFSSFVLHSTCLFIFIIFSFFHQILKKEIKLCTSILIFSLISKEDNYSKLS